MVDKTTAVAVQTAANPDVLTKQKEAASVANQVLKAVIAELAPGKSILEICEFGDAMIEKLTSTMYKKQNIEKGVCFPTCISVNECVGHFSPLKGESVDLKENDVVKIELGVHFDGYCALVAHTLVLTSGPVSGRTADVIIAAYKAAEVACRMIKPGNTNNQVTAALEDIATAYKVNAITGISTNQMLPFNLTGSKSIAQKIEPEARIPEATFVENECYAVDICFTTGEGRPNEQSARTTVFRRVVDVDYILKMKSSRFVFSVMNKKFPVFPFTLRALGDDTQAKLGIVECYKHQVVSSLPVLFEKEGDQIGHFRFTILLLPNGNQKITGMELPSNLVGSDVLLPEYIQAILNTPLSTGKKVKSADVEMS